MSCFFFVAFVHFVRILPSSPIYFAVMESPGLYPSIPRPVVSYIYFDSKEEKMEYIKSLPEFITIEQHLPRRREWVRSFMTSSNTLRTFFDKYPGVVKYIGTKILMFSKNYPNL